MHNKLPTKDRLIRLRIPNVIPLCVMCKIGEDSVRHLFFTCRSVYNIWNLCNNWFGMNSVLHCMPRNHFLGFQLCRISSKCLSVGNTIWKLRNDIIFNNKVFDSQELFCAIQVKSWAVVRAKYKNATFSSDWCIDPVTCISMLL